MTSVMHSNYGRETSHKSPTDTDVFRRLHWRAQTRTSELLSSRRRSQNDACARATAKFVQVTHVESPMRAHRLQGRVYRGLGKKGQGLRLLTNHGAVTQSSIRSVYGQIDRLR